MGQPRRTYPKWHPFPFRDPHPDTTHGMVAEITTPSLHHLRICIPGLDPALVNAALKVLLRFLVHEGTSGDSPEGAFCRKVIHTRDGDTE